jgi:hypothetical protein
MNPKPKLAQPSRPEPADRRFSASLVQKNRHPGFAANAH